MNIKPERWSLVKVKDEVKVMAVWSGGYLSGDAWRLNSGIKDITETEGSYLFEGYSGSVYDCLKTSYGINPYGASVLAGSDLSPMSEEDAMEYIKSKAG